MNRCTNRCLWSVSEVPYSPGWLLSQQLFMLATVEAFWKKKYAIIRDSKLPISSTTSRIRVYWSPENAWACLSSSLCGSFCVKFLFAPSSYPSYLHVSTQTCIWNMSNTTTIHVYTRVRVQYHEVMVYTTLRSLVTSALEYEYSTNSVPLQQSKSAISIWPPNHLILVFKIRHTQPQLSNVLWCLCIRVRTSTISYITCVCVCYFCLCLSVFICISMSVFTSIKFSCRSVSGGNQPKLLT